MKKYKVIGTAPVLDHQPGKTFEADLDQAHEDFLVNAGALRVVGSKKKK